MPSIYFLQKTPIEISPSEFSIGVLFFVAKSIQKNNFPIEKQKINNAHLIYIKYT